MPPRRPPPSSAASVGALLNRAQDTGSAAAHAKLAPHLWAHLGKLGEDAFWGELVGAVDYLLTIAPVSFFLCGGERGTGRGGAGIERRELDAPARERACGKRGPSRARAPRPSGGRFRLPPRRQECRLDARGL